jgi:hypothetical protein
MITAQNVHEYIRGDCQCFINQNKIINKIIEFGLKRYGHFKNKKEIILFSNSSENIPDSIISKDIPEIIMARNVHINPPKRKVTSHNLACVNIEKGIDRIGKLFGLSYLVIGEKSGYDHNNRILALIPEGILAGIFAVTYFKKDIIDNCRSVIGNLLGNKPLLINVSVTETASALFLLFILSKGIDYVRGDLYLERGFNNIFKSMISSDEQKTLYKIFEIQLNYLKKLY